jgi:hypothetical protein
MRERESEREIERAKIEPYHIIKKIRYQTALYCYYGNYIPLIRILLLQNLKYMNMDISDTVTIIGI